MLFEIENPELLSQQALDAVTRKIKEVLMFEGPDDCIITVSDGTKIEFYDEDGGEGLSYVFLVLKEGE